MLVHFACFLCYITGRIPHSESFFQRFIEFGRTNEVVELQTDGEIARFVTGGELMPSDEAPVTDDRAMLRSIKQKLDELQELIRLLEEQWIEINK